MPCEPRVAGDCVVLLARDDELTNALYHALSEKMANVHAIIENRIPRFRLLRRRAQRLGWRVAAGQAAFMVGIVPILRWTAKTRVAEIHQTAHLNKGVIPNPIRVPSVNHDLAVQWLDRLNPAVVVVFGTRILAKGTLNAIKAPTLNLHAGITPLYRGVHGAYWALVDGRPDLVGSTVHFVDEGIDTGKIVSQTTADVSSHDNFATYPHLQFVAGLPLILDAARRLVNKESLEPSTTVTYNIPSVLRSHPTLGSYVCIRLRLGVC